MPAEAMRNPPPLWPGTLSLSSSINSLLFPPVRNAATPHRPRAAPSRAVASPKAKDPVRRMSPNGARVPHYPAHYICTNVRYRSRVALSTGQECAQIFPRPWPEYALSPRRAGAIGPGCQPAAAYGSKDCVSYSLLSFSMSLESRQQRFRSIRCVCLQGNRAVDQRSPRGPRRVRPDNADDGIPA